MGRLIVILGIIFLIWILYRYLSREWSRLNEAKNSEKVENDENTAIKNIKACAYCKTHIPEEDGIKEGELLFCSYQHLDLYNKNHKAKLEKHDQ